jgi:ABC-type polar amino acid transport system ATPase subunit
MSMDVTDKPRQEIIVCRNVRKSYGRFEALRGINTSFRESEKVCLIGPSGGGKSTFLRTLNGLETIDAGSIDVNGIKLPGSKRDILAVRRQVGMVFQSFNLFSHLSVRDNITLAPITAKGLSKREANERAEKLLTRIRILDQIDKYPSQLSGGQQQRVAIARALAMEPQIMLFDEPTSALDPEMIKEVLDVISELGETGMTMLIVTHEMSFARRIADRILFIVGGQIASDAPPEDFFQSTGDERQRAFLSKLL